MKQAIEAPAPGRMPIRLPMIQERVTVGAMRLMSEPESPRRLNLTARARSTMRFSARISTCDIEKRPMRAQVTLIPL